MGARRALAFCLAFYSTLGGAFALFPRSRDSVVNSEPASVLPTSWDAPPSQDQTDNLIFYRLSTLLQHWPNTRYPNGHSIVPGTIPVGTTLYHGRSDAQPPSVHHWLAFDPEHSSSFARGSDNRFITYVTTRELRVLYIDGSSAAKMSTGCSDTQQLFLWGVVNDTTVAVQQKIMVELCEWGKEFGIDGYVRTEAGFEVMHCDFRENVRIVSSAHILPTENTPTNLGSPRTTTSNQGLPVLPFLAEQVVISDEPRPFPPEESRPLNWKSVLPSSKDRAFEMLKAGTRHSRAPGEVRVQLDAARLVTLYDPALPSGIELRRGKQKVLHRGKGMSQEDIATWREWVVGTVREDRPAVSGVDWRALAATIIGRYSARLEYLRSLLRPSRVMHNATTAVQEVRSQLLLALLIDITADDVPDQTDSSVGSSSYYCRSNHSYAWVKPIADRCSSFALSHLPEQMTREERTLYAAVSGTQAEICRVLSLMWVDAYDPSCVAAGVLAEEWRGRVEQLMEWLDWPMWSWCKPECSPGSICFIPTWPIGIGKWPLHYEERLDKIDWTPKCLRSENLYDD